VRIAANHPSGMIRKIIDLGLESSAIPSFAYIISAAIRGSTNLVHHEMGIHGAIERILGF